MLEIKDLHASVIYFPILSQIVSTEYVTTKNHMVTSTQ